ncbi:MULTISPECIES: hypothetical protein [Microbacterium]|uniref:hypothetical protein n=1 Tax=Microbacterium TaxID=33882 RepID=UPI00146ACB35|nr:MULTISPECIES: hypothetical protein [Microbacterium]
MLSTRWGTNSTSACTGRSVEIGNGATSLKLNTDGTVAVLNEKGTQVNFLRKPWATDANGKELATHYTIKGNVVTQHVDLEGAAYPVTADPTFGCGLNWCSMYFNRSETKTIKSGGPAAMAIIAAACGGLGWGGVAVCTAASGAIVGMAEIAYNHGNCVGVVGWWVPPLPAPGWNPFIEKRGTVHCR